jgi:hypothetical protein
MLITYRNNCRVSFIIWRDNHLLNCCIKFIIVAQYTQANLSLKNNNNSELCNTLNAVLKRNSELKLYTLIKVKVTLRLTVSQSVCLGVEPRLGRMEETPSRYGRSLRIYWISSYGQPAWGGPPSWGLGVGLTTPHRKKWACYDNLQEASVLGSDKCDSIGCRGGPANGSDKSHSIGCWQGSVIGSVWFHTTNRNDGILNAHMTTAHNSTPPIPLAGPPPVVLLVFVFGCLCRWCLKGEGDFLFSIMLCF